MIFQRPAFSASLALLLCASLVQAADPLPSLKFKVAYPNLKFNRPLWMEETPDDTKRLVVVEQAGKILIFPRDPATSDPKTFLDITSRKPQVQNEEGLLAFAFHPQYKSNGLLYLFYVQQAPKRDVLSEVHVSKSDPNS